jgi:hypothetical protein
MAAHVGDRGTAETAMHPQGFVRVGGVRMDARSDRGAIEAGADIVVVGGDDVGLVVRKVEDGRAPRLPNHGRRVFTSFGERVAEQGRREDAARQQWLAGRRRYGVIGGVVLGALAAGVGLYVLWDFVREQAADPRAVAALTLLAGAAWGVAVFRFLEGTLHQLGESYWRLTTVSAVLALAGACGGAVLGIPALGLVGGLAAAVGLTFVLGAIVPGIVLMAGAGE